MSVALSVSIGVAVLSAGVAACVHAHRKRAKRQQMNNDSREIDEILKVPDATKTRIGEVKICKSVTAMPTLEVEPGRALRTVSTKENDTSSVEVEQEVVVDVYVADSGQGDLEPGEAHSTELEAETICSLVDSVTDGHLKDSVEDCIVNINEDMDVCESTEEVEASSMFDVEKLRSIADSVTDADLKGLMEDRVAEFIDASRHPDDCALAAVDFLDELSGIESAYDETLSSLIVNMQSVVKDGLKKSGYEILDSDAWNPDMQRAVKISHVLKPDDFPQIAAKRASGLRCQERLIRKQEVEILKA